MAAAARKSQTTPKSDKVVIGVINRANWQLVGMVKSINYDKQSFAITQDARYARKFDVDSVGGYIDDLTMFDLTQKFIFSYGEAGKLI